MRSAFTCCLLMAPLMIAGPSHAAQTPQIGSAVAIVNQVHAAYEQDQRTLQTGDRVHEDELVEVGTDSRGELVLDDSTKLALGPGSRLLLDTFVYNGDRSKGDIVVNLMKGTFRFVTGAASKPSYRIRTPVAAITVRGTIFDTYVQDNGWLWLLLIEGAVRVCNDQGDCRMLNRPGQILQVTDQGRMGQPTRWASLPRRNAVPLETAFPFLIAAPGFDPDPILTRDDVLTGPSPPPRTPPSRGGSKKSSGKTKDRAESDKPRRTREARPQRRRSPVFRFSFDMGGPKKDKAHRDDDRPSRRGDYRGPQRR